jgi:hypothetical protein
MEETRLEISMSRGFALLAACALAMNALPTRTRAQVTPQGSPATVSVKNLSATLGVKPASTTGPAELELGATITFTLSEPLKIAKLGIVGMHEGARVTITRIAPDRIRVEADEMEPMPVSGKATLRVNADGTFTQVADRPPGKPPTI